MKFKNVNDFFLVEEFKENEDGSVQWHYQNSNGFIKSGMITEWEEQTGVNPETNEPIFTTMTFNVYDELLAAAARGEVVIEPVPQAELDAIAAEQAKQTQDALKRTGAEINGHTISLTEENQNGLAAVMQGAQLADEAGASIFPLNFKARTESGEVSIPFADMVEFKAFCLAFLQARQQFF